MAGCTKCGAPIRAGSRSCEYCGSRVDMGEFESVLALTEYQDKQRGEAARAEAEAKLELARIKERERTRDWKILLLMGAVSMLVLVVMALIESCQKLLG